MRLEYQLATISYCPDMTDPHALSIPVSVLLIGRGDDAWVAAAASLSPAWLDKVLSLDPLSRAMLSNVRFLVKKHVDAAFRDGEQLDTPERVLIALQDGLRSSLHVSKIGELQTQDISDSDEAPAEISRLALAALSGVLGEAVAAHKSRLEQQEEADEAGPDSRQDVASAKADDLAMAQVISLSQHWQREHECWMPRVIHSQDDPPRIAAG